MFESLLNFIGSPGGGALAGAALGALGGGDQKTTATSAPNLPANYKTGYDDLLGMGRSYIDAGYQAAPKTRVNTDAPSSYFDALFSNPEMIAIQKAADAKAAMATPAQTMQPTAPQQAPPGYNADTQTYQTPFGAIIRGDAGKKAAEEAAMQGKAETLLRERYGDSGLTQRGGKLWNSYVGTPIGGIATRGDSYENPWLNETYTRAGAQDAINRGDLSAFQREGGIASYNPTPGFLDKIGPLIAAGILAAPAGLAAAGFGGAALPASHGVGSAIANGRSLFSTLGNQLAGRVQ